MTALKTVLVLEDEQTLLNAISKKLQLEGFAVVGLKSVEDARAYVEAGKVVDVIWLDHYLFGKENGLDFVAFLKGNEKFRELPVFVVSNTASPDKVNSYLHLGAERFYTKSDYRLDQIITDIKTYLEKH